jgi:hypothetical protein
MMAVTKAVAMPVYRAKLPSNASNEKLVSVALMLDVKNTNGYPNTSSLNDLPCMLDNAKVLIININELTNNTPDCFFVIGLVCFCLGDFIAFISSFLFFFLLFFIFFFFVFVCVFVFCFCFFSVFVFAFLFF